MDKILGSQNDTETTCNTPRLLAQLKRRVVIRNTAYWLVEAACYDMDLIKSFPQAHI